MISSVQWRSSFVPLTTRNDSLNDLKKPLRLMIYDDTCRRGILGGKGPVGLTHSWIAGALLYKGLGRLDATRGVTSWEEAFDWLARVEPGRTIGEVQFWGHGKWGDARVDRTVFDESSLLRNSQLRPGLEILRDRMTEESLFWFRTCETFGAEVGHSFAQSLSDFLGCDTAGHTYIIGPWQSGLHRLSPGALPHWDPSEGIKSGSVFAPKSALWSSATAPNTISCLGGKIPKGF